MICKGKLGGQVCFSCLAELQDQVVDSALLIAGLSSAVERLSKRLTKMEKNQTVEQQDIEIWTN